MLRSVVGDDVTLVSSAEETAFDVYRELAARELLRPDDRPQPRHRFTSTGDTAAFRRLAQRFLGPQLGPSSWTSRRPGRSTWGALG